MQIFLLPTVGNSVFGLRLFSTTTVNYSYNVHHAINFKSKPENGMHEKDAVAAFKMLYNICNDDYGSNDRKFIGYSNDLNTLSLLYKSGLSEVAVNIENMNDQNPSSNNQIMNMPNYGKGCYKPCMLHQNLNDLMKQHCAKVKSLIRTECCQKNDELINLD